MKKFLKIALVLLIIGAIAGVVIFFVVRNNNSKGNAQDEVTTITMKDNIKLDYSGFGTPIEQTNPSSSINISLFKNLNVKFGNNISVQSSSIKLSSQSEDFYARVKFKVEFYYGKNIVKIDNADELISISNFFGSSWVDSNLNDGWFYYGTGTTFKKFVKNNTTNISLINKNALIIVDCDKFVRDTTNNCYIVNGIKIDTVNVLLTLETLNGKTDPKTKNWNIITAPITEDFSSNRLLNNNKVVDANGNGYEFEINGDEIAITNLVGTPNKITLPDYIKLNNINYKVTTIISLTDANACKNLTSITIPRNISSISTGVFYYCINLNEMLVNIENKKYFSSGNCIIEKSSKTLIAGCKSSVIPTDGSVTSIGNEAFRGCSGLIDISIPNSVTSIGKSAFRSCNNLKSITLHDNITNIGSNAFQSCGSLTSFTIPKNIKEIAAAMFTSCSSLTTVTIPEGVISIGSWAFSGCDSLTTIEIPKSVTSLGQWVFMGCGKLQSITISENIQTIGDLTFYNCVKLTEVIIASSSIAALESSGCELLANATNVYVKTGLTVGKYITDDFLKQASSDKVGYDKYVKKS